MNRFVIVDGLPFLLANGKTFAVRWDEKGFTVGTEVKLASVPVVTFSELSIKAKCAGHLDSIGKEQEEDLSEQQQEQEEDLSEMTLAELKEYAKAHGVVLGDARKKADIIETIRNAQDVNANDYDG